LLKKDLPIGRKLTTTSTLL